MEFIIDAFRDIFLDENPLIDEQPDEVRFYDLSGNEVNPDEDE